MHTENRLAQEKSPYLLQHKTNPVDWYAWSEEAFEKARRENKPIFLSVGYSTCHWCHVMERESFESEEIAKILKEDFVSIKVDREERPDVDRVYMTFVQATTGSGGWPMSVFLTPELKPFYGGTYFPPEDRYGRPGFKSLLKQIASLWENKRERIVEQGEEITAALQQHVSASTGVGEIGANVIDVAHQQIASSFDEELGGFGPAPKFPRPVTLNFLFRVYARDCDSEQGKKALHMALKTLREMAEGGMHDHLGGGFHRYSVDRSWHVPHFEKMLYDQAQLAVSYLEAFQITGEKLYANVARDVLRYVERDMTDAKGGFYSAEDADSLVKEGSNEKAEGAFYVWTKREIEEVVGHEAAEVFDRHYGIESGGNAPAESDPHGEFKDKNIPIQRYSVEETARIVQKTPEEVRKILDESRQKLFDVRSRRPRPHLDDKIITAWNGLIISAFARAAQVLSDEKYAKIAASAAQFVRKNLFADDILLRSYRHGPGEVEGFADDYAFLIQGLLDLFETTFEIEWLKWALDLQRKQDELFFDANGGGYFSVSADRPNILLRMKEDYDGAEPSPNSVAALNLLRLAQMTGNEELAQRAEKTINAFAQQIERIPVAMPQMLVALNFLRSTPKQIIIAGDREKDETRELLREVHRHFVPNKILLLAGGGSGQEWLAKRLDFLKNLQATAEKATAFVCENYVCQLPVHEPSELKELLN